MQSTGRSSGLDGVTVAETELSEVDGERGRLTVRGSSVRELARRSQLEVAAQLWRGFVEPGLRAEAGVLAPRFAEARREAHAIAIAHAERLRGCDARAGLRWLLAALGTRGAEPGPDRIAGALPVFVAALGRLGAAAALAGARGGRARQAHGAALLEPRAEATPAADFLYLLTGKEPTAAAERAIDAYWATVADHGMNASTFTARVIASTGAELLPGVLGALGALEGPLHGGAPGPVLDMLDAIGTPENAAAWLARELDAGRRLMGFGHRIYRVRDPRADVLAESAASLESPYLSLAKSVERAALESLRRHKPDRALATNVEFYTALVLDAVGVPRELFTATFAAGRVLGWIAHMLEQRRTGRLIRPAARYVGPAAA